MQQANIIHIMITNKYEPQQKHRLGTVSKKLLGGLNIEKVSRDRNIEKWLQTTPEDWNNKSIKWMYGETF